MQPSDTADPTHRPVTARFGQALQVSLDRALVAALRSMMGSSAAGTLNLTLPSGACAQLGQAGQGLEACLVVENYSALWRSWQRGALGFADGYMAGELHTSSLNDVFRFYMRNEQAVTPKLRSALGSGWTDRWFHRRRANTRTGSRRNISAHYDLGNEFYRLWLDAGLTYSSGIYTRPGMSLEEAQSEKYARILEALTLEPGHRVLEIGCGWGGFAHAAALRGAEVTGITISEQQYAAACSRIASAGLSDRAHIRFQDYRDTAGQFDRIASIEMIEAVGEENWRTFFGVVSDRLKPGGSAVLQVITIKPELFDEYRRNPDFIQRYIFPGGMLPTTEHMRSDAAAAGLGYEEIETFGSSYARTLADWLQRFELAWPRVEALGFDERFRRKWEYYLAYCEVGFELGHIDVGLYRFTKPAGRPTSAAIGL